MGDERQARGQGGAVWVTRQTRGQGGAMWVTRDKRGAREEPYG